MMFRNDPYHMDFCRIALVDGTSVPSFDAVSKASDVHQQTQQHSEGESPMYGPAASGVIDDSFQLPPSMGITPRSHMVESSESSSNALICPCPDCQPETQRARTMQHLLQHVPYLALEEVREATHKGEDRVRGSRVGDGVSAWTGIQLRCPVRTRDVFVAQLPFDMPLDVLQVISNNIVPGPPVRIIHAAPHHRKGKAYDGCAFVKILEEDADRFIDALHKRVLFDVDGVWVATSVEEQAELTSYCAWMQEQRPEQRRTILTRPTPFSAMTAEFALKGSHSRWAV